MYPGDRLHRSDVLRVFRILHGLGRRQVRRKLLADHLGASDRSGAVHRGLQAPAHVFRHRQVLLIRRPAEGGQCRADRLPVILHHRARSRSHLAGAAFGALPASRDRHGHVFPQHIYPVDREGGGEEALRLVPP